MTGGSSAAGDRDHWAAQARDWIAWARKPGHDAFWAYRAAFAAFVGPGSAAALDVGCGEGRLSRLLGELGHKVAALDPVPDFIAAARGLDSAGSYHLAPADALPFADASFDLVLAYNMLMDLDDPAAALTEMARVLAPGGRLVISVVHPFADRGRRVDAGDASDLALSGTYFGRQAFSGQDSRDGLTMHFRGWSMPLSAYADLIAAAGLAIARIAEPRPDPASRWTEAVFWSRFPLFLWIEARPLSGQDEAPAALASSALSPF